MVSPSAPPSRQSSCSTLLVHLANNVQIACLAAMLGYVGLAILSWHLHHFSDGASFMGTTVKAPVNATWSNQTRSVMIHRPPSPFEQRTGAKVPNWALKKDIFFEKPELQAPSIDHQICLVHVGKTAGSTMACHLGFRYGCVKGLIAIMPDGRPEDVPRMVKRTTHLIHNGINDCHSNMSYYMFTIRHPVYRIQSWFRYEFPYRLTDNHWEEKRPLFLDCNLNRLQDLANAGMISLEEATAMVDRQEHVMINETHHRRRPDAVVCRQRAYAAIQGTTAYVRHNYYNYEYFWGNVPTKYARIAAIRTEHLEHDWNRMEQILQQEEKDEQGGSSRFNASSVAPFKIQKSLNPSKFKQGMDSELTPEALDWLCRTLCREIQVYKRILYEAVNLHDDDKKVSMQELAETCPNQARELSCPTSEYPARSYRLVHPIP